MMTSPYVCSILGFEVSFYLSCPLLLCFGSSEASYGFWKLRHDYYIIVPLRHSISNCSFHQLLPLDLNRRSRIVLDCSVLNHVVS